MNALLDFALNEYLVDGHKSAIELYIDRFRAAGEIEREVMNAFLSPRPSLFRITSVIPDESFIVLNDLLNYADDSYKLQENSQDKEVRLTDRLSFEAV